VELREERVSLLSGAVVQDNLRTTDNLPNDICRKRSRSECCRAGTKVLIEVRIWSE